MSMMVHEVRNAEASAVAAAVATAEEAALEPPPGMSSSGIAAGHMLNFLFFKFCGYKLAAK